MVLVSHQGVISQRKRHMNVDTVIKCVCRMPIDFKQRGNVSMISLLNESGYINYRDKIDENKIIRYLKEDKSIVDSWISFSEDQRCTPSWYFDGKTVGYINTSGKAENEEHYDDSVTGCASYIKKILEDLIKTKGREKRR